MSAKKVTLSFGALSDSIEKQLRDQGLQIDKDRAEFFERDSEAIRRLYLRDVLTEAETKKARQRLLKKIVKEVRPL